MKSLANAVRACDSCLKKRAHWYCAADEAFLCESCDTSVHSANALARRHKRVLLKNTSPLEEGATWHDWFTRKPRTPRGSCKRNNLSTSHDLVPEISAGDQTNSSDQSEGQLICHVPVVDTMVVEPKIKVPVMVNDDQEDKDNAESCLNGFFPTDMELEAFAADVETLLGGGLDTESYTMEELGLSNTEMFNVKKDEEETKAMNIDIEICNDDDQDYLDGTMPFDLSFDFDSQSTYEEDAIKSVESSGECVKVKEEEQKNGLMLKLNYNQVISTWGGQGLPWTSGGPPKLDVDISGSPVVSMGYNGGESHQKHYVGRCVPSSGVGDGGRKARVSRKNTSSGVGDGGREASVSRYREKRRRRLFSKKIRYEVRRLSAESKPRMKGRFVKRASLAASAGNSPLV
ncbi:hypothetical protein N665_5305s0002 [Sinapis alba]|nr:hypothetical protein N665_5305s0002 [Sinapis alba]